MSPLLLSAYRARLASPTVLLLTSCPWTARALHAGLGGAGLTVLRTDDYKHGARLWAGDLAQAALVDERTGVDAAGRGVQHCRELAAARAGKSSLPLLVLTRAPVTPGERRALRAAGAWGIAPYPVGTRDWVRRLETWIAAGVGARP